MDLEFRRKFWTADKFWSQQHLGGYWNPGSEWDYPVGKYGVKTEKEVRFSSEKHYYLMTG